MAQPGDLVAILDACLVNGFGAKAPDGNKITISAGVATVEFSGGNDFEKHAVIEISGATPAALNDVWRVTGATATTFTFDCPGIPDGAASGSIIVKRAAPGYWEKAFGDNLVAAYRSVHPDATSFFLRIDNSASGNSAHQVRGYEQMTGIDNFALPFPTTSEETDLTWRPTASSSSAVLPRPWVLVADESWIYFMPYMDTSAVRRAAIYQFGDFIKIDNNDNHNCVITGHATNNPGSGYSGTSQYELSRFNQELVQGCWIARRKDALTEASDRYARYGYSKVAFLGGEDPYPNPANEGDIFVGPIYVHQQHQRMLRGTMPGILSSLSGHESITKRADNFAGELGVVLDAGPNNPEPILIVALVGSGSTIFCVGFKITGGWR
jgi:hypothetical protein